MALLRSNWVAVGCAPPSASSAKTFSAMILDLHVTPATPSELLVAAPIVPAQCVPWPSRSCTPEGLLVASIESALTRPARSGCEASMPVSITATVTSSLPTARAHASYRWMVL